MSENVMENKSERKARCKKRGIKGEKICEVIRMKNKKFEGKREKTLNFMM